MTNELVSQFLGQNIRSNTIELKYDFTRRVSAYLGYDVHGPDDRRFQRNLGYRRNLFSREAPAGNARRMITSPRAEIAHWSRGALPVRLHAERERFDSRRFAHESRAGSRQRHRAKHLRHS